MGSNPTVDRIIFFCIFLDEGGLFVPRNRGGGAGEGAGASGRVGEALGGVGGEGSPIFCLFPPPLFGPKTRQTRTVFVSHYYTPVAPGGAGTGAVSSGRATTALGWSIVFLY